MERKMFGHRLKKVSNSGRTPGEPTNTSAYDHDDENEKSYKYVKSKDAYGTTKGSSEGRVKGGPAGYEGNEHVKYKDPGYTRHSIRFPEDEPHMKSHVGKEEMHEMEDNFHMDVPDQTKYALESKIKRARMKMDAPDQEDPKPLRGNLVETVGEKGIEDTTGDELMGPNYMQSSGGDKEKRKKMIAAVAKRKMKKRGE